MDLIRTFAILALGCILSAGLVASARTSEAVDEPDPLPSWHEGLAKKSIRAFVKRVTTEGTKDFVPIPERIAVFDNDGTLWPEAPLVGQLAFIIDEVMQTNSTSSFTPGIWLSCGHPFRSGAFLIDI